MGSFSSSGSGSSAGSGSGSASASSAGPAGAAAGPGKERIAELCRAAGDYVQRALGMTLPHGEDSLAFVDHYVRAVRDKGRVSDEILVLLSAALGAHLGEVAIARFGGQWRGVPPIEPGEPGAAAEDPAHWRVELAAAPLTFDPVGMAAETLRGGEVEGYDAGMTTRPDLSEALLEALGRNPVLDDYYYSLTGRLETLAYAVELLNEFERQHKERAEQQRQGGRPAAPETEPDDEDDDDKDADGGAGWKN